VTETDNAAEAALDPDAGSPLGDADATQLAALVAGASDEQLAEGMADAANRQRVLDEIFKRMAEHVNEEAAQGVDAVVHFRITEHPEGGEDVYEVEIQSGHIEVTNEPGKEPRVAFVVGPVDFLRLVTGSAAGPMLFMSGKLKIEGDMMFAAQLTSLFTIPTATS
jgi:putative sterol carrier protein